MPLILPLQCPSVRRARGRSFGPMTTIATTAITRISLQLMSNMKSGARAADRAAAGRDLVPALADLGLLFRRLVLDRLVDGLGFVFVAQPALEALNALGNVAHQLGNL